MFSEELVKEIEQNRVRLTDTLLVFIKTDTILFAFNEECENCFNRFLSAANKVLNTVFVLTTGLEVAEVNLTQDNVVRNYLDSLSIQKFVLVYWVATQVRSVLLSVLFVEKHINSEQLLNTAFFEELWQQKKWGETAEAEERYCHIRDKLRELEVLRDGKSLS